MSKKENFDLLGRLVAFLMTIPQFWGILVDLAEKLNSKNGEQWAKGLARFLRKEELAYKKRPYVLEGWKVESHKEEAFQRDPSKITLYLSEGQKQRGRVQGFKLRKELENQPVLNANTLDYLLAHPELIPEEWKGKQVCFWGTIYRVPDGGLHVRYLSWQRDRWSCGHVFACLHFDSFTYDRPAACSQV